MGDRSFEAGSQNYGVVYEHPPPAPFLAAPLALSPSPITTPPKYRAIQPRPSECGPDAEKLDDKLKVKPRRRRRSKTRRNHPRRPQERSGESKPVQLEADVNKTQEREV
ncbi:hypothetical protein N7517_008200 [Penicillium concentricum]|uniref:Uncharacterized protein n=1 Tax=Penicillium concentricum TaxID=293559 RepID=A0A9W9RUL7_9EURO|nr:uncharacterized protein N7517_008200 [Penicillium concentricum]KAJ5365314.1 hypothetical protein N7517_008200 [Penicillium concentricum]